MATEMTRRTFVKTAAAAGLAASFASPRARGANERIRMAFIGVGNRGGQLIEATLPHQDAEIVALCDVYQPYLDKWCEKLGPEVKPYRDFRDVFAREDIDAVAIGTPDHWHAIMTIDACRAGKDVYVEKPMCFTIKEGRRMVEVAKETGRVVQVGMQRRSSAMYAELGERIRGGEFGHVTMSRAYRISNMAPTGMGKAPDSDPPADLDWDMWLGPRPMRPFNSNIAPYKFRWWKEYSSQMTNWGVHYFDLLRWLNGDEAPSAICALGGKYAVDDDRTIPDTMQATFEFPAGRLLLFGQYEASGNLAIPGEIEVRASKGTIYGMSNGYKVLPEKSGQFQEWEKPFEPIEVKSTDPELTQEHMRNFLDCVRSRETPKADAEAGHRSTAIAHLGNISLETKSLLQWDGTAERITNNEAANALLHYEYRAPWTLG